MAHLLVHLFIDPPPPPPPPPLSQPQHPLMVMEFWTGWFDHWGEKHLGRNISPQDFNKELRNILAEGASVNLYMFHGGTNFGFMNGANWGDGEEIGQTYRSTVSSYGM